MIYIIHRYFSYHHPNNLPIMDLLCWSRSVCTNVLISSWLSFDSVVFWNLLRFWYMMEFVNVLGSSLWLNIESDSSRFIQLGSCWYKELLESIVSKLGFLCKDSTVLNIESDTLELVSTSLGEWISVFSNSSSSRSSDDWFDNVFERFSPELFALCLDVVSSVMLVVFLDTISSVSDFDRSKHANSDVTLLTDSSSLLCSFSVSTGLETGM